MHSFLLTCCVLLFLSEDALDLLLRGASTVPLRALMIPLTIWRCLFCSNECCDSISLGSFQQQETDFYCPQVVQLDYLPLAHCEPLVSLSQVCCYLTRV